jgi:succinate dehydrogenase / fumarate reductase iron-sulfur subunit
VFMGDKRYVGPQAIVAAHRFIFDSRDRAAAERLSLLNDNSGACRCRTVFNCTGLLPARDQGDAGDHGREAGPAVR